MRTVALAVLLVISAQLYAVTDVLAGHSNGGRGCVGCHPPHYNPALFGPDIEAFDGKTLLFGDGGMYPVEFPQSFSQQTGLIGISMCLSCHDGNIAKNAMMANQSFEQMAGLLPSTYGSQTIPTLLGADGGAAGNYFNDHPVGPAATLGAVGVAKHLVLTSDGGIVIKSDDIPYQNFMKAYGAPQIVGGMMTGYSTIVIPNGASDPSTAYITCITCHNPHSMNVYSATEASPITGQTSGTYSTFFFVNAPYNPAANPAPGQDSSATQFCRQCHFDGDVGANESSGIEGVTTAF